MAHRKDLPVYLLQFVRELGEAAGACKGTPMENIILSIYDELIDLKLDLGKQVNTFEQRLNGVGNEMPISWKEAG